MARPYSLDLRERVVAQVARGLTHQEVADLNGIVSSTVSKWWGRQREMGSPAARRMGGRRPRNSRMSAPGFWRALPRSLI